MYLPPNTHHTHVVGRSSPIQHDRSDLRNLESLATGVSAARWARSAHNRSSTSGVQSSSGEEIGSVDVDVRGGVEEGVVVGLSLHDNHKSQDIGDLTRLSLGGIKPRRLGRPAEREQPCRAAVDRLVVR